MPGPSWYAVPDPGGRMQCAPTAPPSLRGKGAGGLGFPAARRDAAPPEIRDIPRTPLGRVALPAPEPIVTGVPRRGDPPVRHRRADRATRLVQVAAIPECARAEEGAELREAAGQIADDVCM